jgi:hypothetical protein
MKGREGERREVLGECGKSKKRRGESLPMWRKRGIKATGRDRETRELSIHIRCSIQFFKQPVGLLHSTPPPFHSQRSSFHPTQPLVIER